MRLVARGVVVQANTCVTWSGSGLKYDVLAFRSQQVFDPIGFTFSLSVGHFVQLQLFLGRKKIDFLPKSQVRCDGSVVEATMNKAAFKRPFDLILNFRDVGQFVNQHGASSYVVHKPCLFLSSDFTRQLQEGRLYRSARVGSSVSISISTFDIFSPITLHFKTGESLSRAIG